MHYGAIFQPAIPQSWQECFYTTLYVRRPNWEWDLLVLLQFSSPFRSSIGKTMYRDVQKDLFYVAWTLPGGKRRWGCGITQPSGPLFDHPYTYYGRSRAQLPSQSPLAPRITQTPGEMKVTMEIPQTLLHAVSQSVSLRMHKPPIIMIIICCRGGGQPVPDVQFSSRGKEWRKERARICQMYNISLPVHLPASDRPK